jgi:multidrug efflux system outer membrane protein
MMKTMKTQPKKTAPLLAMLLAMAGCAHVTPDLHPLTQRDIAGAELASGIKLAREGWPQAQWWTAYHDEQLNALIKQALASLRAPA